MRLAHHASLAAGGLAGATLARWLGVPSPETFLLVAGAGAMALSVAAGLAEDEDRDAADEDGRGGPAQGMASSSRTGMARVIPSRLSQVAKTQGRSLRSIVSP